MPALNPIAARVARRYLAEVWAEAERVAIEYQRRPHGLGRVDEDEDDAEDIAERSPTTRP